jgi:FKBP-type peptidyl-prolyl cis-trans isomerase FkpA
MKIKLYLFSIIMTLGLSSCLKDDYVDPTVQAEKDDATIVKFIADNKISAIKHPSGLYYQIIQSGSGNISYSVNTTVTANYTGRLLSGQVFDKSTTQPLSFKLGQVIVGWQIGVPLIQKGGKIRLFIPSGYAYGPQGSGAIPSNSVLDFDIELVDVQN